VEGSSELDKRIKQAQKIWHESLGSLTALEQVIRSACGNVTPEMMEEYRRRCQAERKWYALYDAMNTPIGIGRETRLNQWIEDHGPPPWECLWTERT